MYSIKATTLEGAPADLSQYQGKVVLVVNVASRCGFTGQYAGLQKLYETYKAKGSKTIYEVSSKEKLDNWKVRKADIFQSTTINSISRTSLTIKRFENKSFINPWSVAPWDNDSYLSATIHKTKFNNTNRPALDKITSTYVSRVETFE